MFIKYGICYFTTILVLVILGNNEKFVQHLNINFDNLCYKNKKKWCNLRHTFDLNYRHFWIILFIVPII